MAYVAIQTLEQRSPDRIERKLRKMESVETSANIPKEQPLRIMDIITIPDSLDKYFGHMPTAANKIRQFNGFLNLLTRNRQLSLERRFRKRYDDNCFFTHNIVNLPSWKRLEDSECTRNS